MNLELSKGAVVQPARVLASGGAAGCAQEMAGPAAPPQGPLQ